MLASALIRKRALQKKGPKYSSSLSRRTNFSSKLGVGSGYIGRGGGALAAVPERSKGEIKGVDTPLNSIAVSLPDVNSNLQGLCLNLIQTGSGFWNREGRKINLKSLRIKATFDWIATPYAGDAINAMNLRMVVVHDKSPNGGTLPKFNEIFAHTEQTSTTTTLWNSPPAFSSMQRFTVLRDKVLDLNPNGYVPTAGGELEVTTTVDEYIKLTRYDTIYAGTANPATIANVYSGGLYIYLFPSFTPSTLLQLIIDPSSIARLRYYD